MRALSLSLAATASLVAACSTAAPAVTAASRPSQASGSGRTWLPAERLMDACWEPNAPPDARVELVFHLEAGTLKQVSFDAQGGATPAVGRCAREVALSYPWPQGGVPERRVLTPAKGGPSGWAQLAYAALLAEDRAQAVGGGAEEATGLRNPAPLVHACLQGRGATATRARFTVQSLPTRVEVLRDGEARGSGPRLPVERCVAAVLGATAWPNSRGYTLDFQRMEDAPPPAPPEAVAAYFADAQELPPLSPEVVHAGMGRLRPAVAVCWEAALRRRPDLSGGRSVQFVVGVDGAVRTATVAPHGSDAAEEAADYLLDRCLLGALGGLRFQPPDKGPARGSWSWVFAHR